MSPKYPKISIAKLIFLFIGFSGIIFSLGILLLKKHPSSQILTSNHTTTDKTPPPSQKLFYKTIGNEPLNQHQKSIPSSSVEKQQYTLELGIFFSQAEAINMIKNLEQQGFQAFYTPFNNNGNVVYRVRTGIYDTKSAAESEKTKLSEKNLSSKTIQLF
jgi:cell division septation protein DedD